MERAWEGQGNVTICCNSGYCCRRTRECDCSFKNNRNQSVNGLLHSAPQKIGSDPADGFHMSLQAHHDLGKALAQEVINIGWAD